MEGWVKRILDGEKERRGLPLEVKLLNGNYYLYHSTSRYDPSRRRGRKVSEYIGRITPSGVVEKGVERRTVFEYGNSQLLLTVSRELIDALKESFYDRWEEIFALSCVRVIGNIPLRLVKDRWEKLHLSTIIDAHLSQNTLSEVLREVGKDYASQKALFDLLMNGSRRLVFDLSSIFSYSENLVYAEKGHNADHLYLPQVNFVLFYSLDKRLPVYMKPLPGSVRDVKALRNVIDEVGSGGTTILVLDRGFASYDLASLLLENRVSFVMPLRRNFLSINYGARTEGSFLYHERGILYSKKRYGRNKYFVYLFEDVKLRAEEASTFISLISERKRTQKDYEREKVKFGKIAILSDMDVRPKEVYLLYKEREGVEQVLDAMKNELENDKSYLGDDDALRGYFFVSFVSLYMYCLISRMIREKNLADRVSVKEVLLKFSKVYEVDVSGKKKLSEIPKGVRELDEQLNAGIFPKNL
jgi:transposase